MNRFTVRSKFIKFSFQLFRNYSVCLNSSKSLIRVEGVDAVKFLQGLTTNKITLDNPVYTGFLNTQGRVLFDSFIYPKVSNNGTENERSNELYVEIDKVAESDFLKHLKKYNLRSRCSIAKIPSEELSIKVIWDVKEEIRLKDTVAYAKDPRFSKHRLLRMILPTSTCTSSSSGSLDDYKVFRYRNGIPEGPQEIIPSISFPLESNMDWMKGIDFHKGCYLGQELTVRTYYTGVTRKRIFPFIIPNYEDNPSQVIEPSAPLSIVAKQGEPVSRRSPGKIIAILGKVGLALVRLQYLKSDLACNGIPIQLNTSIWLDELSSTPSENS
ncbi:putative transferase caf17, mitochondrial [Schizosaccharomyces pombe]